MSHRRHKPRPDPSYRLHKQSGQAIVTLPDGLGGRRDALLGPHGTEESKEEYRRILAEWKAGGARPPAGATVSVNELLLAYVRHADVYYRHPDGTPTSESGNIKLALRWVKRLYGLTDAGCFDVLALEAVRKAMVNAGLCRGRINKDVARIRRAWKWAAGKKLVAVACWQELCALEGLRAGRSEAAEREPVGPVAWAVVEPVLKHVTPQVAAMLQLQYHTGARPGEALIMRTCDLDTSGAIWVYTPRRHKTQWRGHKRTILIGPRGQAVLKPWLRLNLEEYLFQPREARSAWEAGKRRTRKSKLTPSQAARKRKRNPKRKPGERYTPATYAQAVQDGCRKAGEAQKLAPEDIVYFTPNQLRHAKATEIRREAGIDAARAVLGHRSPAVTEVYAELDLAKAREVMERLG